jgi:cysteine-rich repeat protein
VNGDEQCDDGNVAGGDGCSATCTFEDLDRDGVRDLDDACLGTQIPERVPTHHLNVQRYAIMTGTPSGGGVAFDSSVRGNGKKSPPVLTTLHTRGCSCDQMLARLGIGEGDEHRFGCTGTTVSRWTGVGGW